MSEHHHSLKRETFHENRPPFVSSANQVDSLSEHRPQKAERGDRRERGRGDEIGGGGGCEVLAGDQLRVLCNNGGNSGFDFDFTPIRVEISEPPLNFRNA